MPVAPRDEPDESLIHGTRMESVEEIQELARARAAAQKPMAKEADQADTQRYRPSRRPPVLMLCILDDGSSDDGEWFRVRDARVVIGRSQGEITIPHDDMMSSKHAELVRQGEKGNQKWVLNDLGSTNGTYLRVTKALLKQGQEFLVGGHRFRFEPGAGQAETTPLSFDEEEAPKGTRGWQKIDPAGAYPLLVELTPQGEGQRFFLKKPEQWLGRNAKTCEVVLPDDPLLSPRHAKLYRDAKGRWWVENAKSLNGTWLRITQMPLERAGQFQLGEQRFAVKIQS